MPGKAMRQREFAFNLKKIVCMATSWQIKKVKDLERNIFKYHKHE